MKRMLHISLVCVALAIAAGVTAPYAWADQRIEAVSPSHTATGEQGHIHFVAGSTEAVFNVYSITGQLMKVVRVPAGTHATLELPRGFYIVKCNNQWSRKVVVR
jgi:hypothetical protein